MTHDKFINEYVSALKTDIYKLKDDLANANFTDMYSVGKLQGLIAGREDALRVLDSVYADQDN